MGASPIAVPTGNPGDMANAMSGLREAIKLLEGELPKLPTGSDPYKSVLAAIQGLSKHVSPSSESPGIQQTKLASLQAQAQKAAPLQALMRSLGGAGTAGAGSPAGGAPAAAAPAAIPAAA